MWAGCYRKVLVFFCCNITAFQPVAVALLHIDDQWRILMLQPRDGVHAKKDTFCRQKQNQLSVTTMTDAELKYKMLPWVWGWCTGRETSR